MKPEDLDWTFDVIPTDDELGSAAPLAYRPPASRRPAPTRPRARPRPARWRLFLLLAVLGGAGLSLFAATRLGWQRLEAQLEREILYEERYARAGEVNLVQAVQADESKAWLQIRAVEVKLGLAAPLPAGHLMPLDEPPSVLVVESAGSGVYQARVLRRYADSAGQAYAFELTQRYRNLGPGQWERLPPDTSSLAGTTTWRGEWISATLPQADAPLFSALLPQADAAVDRACRDWGCPPGLVVPLFVAGQLDDLPVLAPKRNEADGLRPYPLTFDLMLDARHEPPRLVLASPHLAGWPHDAAAEAALGRAVAVRTLIHLADLLDAGFRTRSDFFRMALIARAEIRLGLSPAPDLAVTAEHYTPPENLWNVTQRVPDGPNQAHYQRQALAFLDFALAGQPASVDGQLLRGPRRNVSLTDWLSRALGPSAATLPDRWAESVGAALARDSELAWDSLAGLAYGCQPEAWLVRDGRLLALPGARPQWDPNWLSPDGRYLAFVTKLPWVPAELRVLDLHTEVIHTIDLAAGVVLFGWSADGYLVYMRAASGAGNVLPEPVLVRADLEGRRQVVLDGSDLQPVWSRPQWLPDRRTVAVLVENTQTGRAAELAWALVDVVQPTGVQQLIAGTSEIRLSPDGRWLAYGTWQSPANTSERLAALEVLDLSRQQRRTLLTAADLPAGMRSELRPVGWTADTGEVVVEARDAEAREVGLFAVAPAEGQVREIARLPERLGWPADLSADGRYLTLQGVPQVNAGEMSLTVLDLHSGEWRLIDDDANDVSWSPTGHALAIASRSGVYVVDAAAGQTRWITFKNCERIAWHPLGSRDRQ